MQMLQFLADDHQQTARLMQQLLVASENAEQRSLFIELKHKLEAHARIEEEIFYPALRSSNGRNSRIDDSVADHEAVQSLLLQMEQALIGSEQWLERLEELKNKVEHHVRAEESDLFPQAQATLPPERQDELFERMLVRKTELAGESAYGTAHSARSAGPYTTSRPSEQAHEHSRTLGQQGESALEQGAGVAAEQTRRFARALHATSENLEKEDQAGLSQYLREAANGLNQFSNRLTHGDIDGLLQEACDTAKRNPVLLLGGAIAAGFLLTRFVKSTNVPATETTPDERRAEAQTPYSVPTETPIPTAGTARHFE